MMRKYQAKELPPKGHFHYKQGVFLLGVNDIYEICHEEKYFSYIKHWVDSVMDEEGGFYFCRPEGDLDDIQPGRLLFSLYDKTGEEKYRRALEQLMSSLKRYPKNSQGGYWHKDIFMNQMWLDGLYMAGPISAE